MMQSLHKKIGLLLLIVLVACSSNDKEVYQGYVVGENIFLASPYSGILEHLIVERGQAVERGQLLFRLDPNPQQMLVQQYQADLQQGYNVLKDLQNPRRQPEIESIQAQIKQTEAEIALANIRVHRMETLYVRQATDKDSLDAAVAHYKSQVELKAQYEAELALAKLGSREEQIKAQEARIMALKAQLKEGEWQVQQKTMTAPASGIIFDTYFRQGEFVGAQQPVLSLLTPNNIYIEFFVPVEAIGHVTLGQTVQVRCYGCATSTISKITYISPEAQFLPPLVFSRENSDKIVFRIQASLLKPFQYKPGQPVTVSL